MLFVLFLQNLSPWDGWGSRPLDEVLESKKGHGRSGAVITAPGLFGPIPWPTSHGVVAADAEPSVMLTNGAEGQMETVPKKIGPNKKKQQMKL